MYRLLQLEAAAKASAEQQQQQQQFEQQQPEQQQPEQQQSEQQQQFEQQQLPTEPQQQPTESQQTTEPQQQPTATSSAADAPSSTGSTTATGSACHECGNLTELAEQQPCPRCKRACCGDCADTCYFSAGTGMCTVCEGKVCSFVAWAFKVCTHTHTCILTYCSISPRFACFVVWKMWL